MMLVNAIVFADVSFLDIKMYAEMTIKTNKCFRSFTAFIVNDSIGLTNWSNVRVSNYLINAYYKIQ